MAHVTEFRPARNGKKSKYWHYVDEDPNFKGWLDEKTSQSYLTARNYFTRLCYICDLMHTTPEQIRQKGKQAIKTGDFEDLENFMIAVKRKLEGQNQKNTQGEELNEARRSTLIRNYMIPLTSWIAKVVGRHNVPQVKVSTRYDQPGKYDNEKSPTPEELQKILDCADIRSKVIICIIGFIGGRPEIQGMADGSDGLVISDFKELQIDNSSKTISFSKVPCRVVVRKSVSKMENQYFSFFPEQGCNFLKNYLEFRMRGGETLGSNSPIIAPSKLNPMKNHPDKTAFIISSNVSRGIRIAIRKAGLSYRPYNLRRYCESKLDRAEDAGIITDSRKKFFMGHTSDISIRYGAGKDLPEDEIEQLREIYKKASKFLVTTLSKDDVTMDALLGVLLTDEEQKKYNLETLSIEDAGRLVRNAIQDLVTKSSKLQAPITPQALPPLPQPKLVRKWVDKAAFHELLLQPGSKKIEQDGDEYLVEVIA